MSKKILITGGAGFIGSHLVDKLIEVENHNVTVLDILDEQVHGKLGKPPEYLNKRAKFIRGSVTDYKRLEDLVRENEIVFHLAAKVGVGQSMYQIEKYISHNVAGTAVLLDLLVNNKNKVKKIIGIAEQRGVQP